MYAVKGLARRILKPSQPLPYHSGHAQEANAICKTIESQRGSLSKSIAKKCEDYAVEVLGNRQYAPWLYVYALIAGDFKEGWIPDNFYGANVIPRIKGYYGNFSSLKPLNSSIFASPAFPDIGSYVNGLFFNCDYKVIPASNFKDILFKDYGHVVYKADKSSQGKGIYFFDKKNFDIGSIIKIGNGVFQRYIKPHALLSEYTPNSVATLRMTTIMDDEGRTSVRSAYLRLGTGEDTHVKFGTNVRVPVNVQTGDFSDVGYLASWLTTTEHPTSAKRFDGDRIPNYTKCVEVVTSLHLKVPYVRCVGWDLTVDEDGEVAILEWNAAHNDIKFSEATQGPCFADLGWEKFR